MPATTYLNNLELNYSLGQTSYTPATTLYIALSTTSPNINGTGVTEPSGGAYARIAITNNKTNLTTSTNATLNNAIQIEFPESTASWGTVTNVCIYDALTGGNLLYFGALTASKIVQSATTVLFATGTLVFTRS